MTSSINVNVDAVDKEIATSILNDLGLDMDTYINMAIKQVVKTGGVPFKITNPKPNRKLRKALKEGEKIIKEIETGKREGYHDIEKMFEDLNK